MIVEKYTPDAMPCYTVVLRVEGLIKLGESAELFQAALEHVLRDADVVIVDLSHLDYIDSTGIGELVGLLVTSAKEHHQVMLSGIISDRVLKLLKLAEYDRATQLFVTEEEALDAVALSGWPGAKKTEPIPSSSPAHGAEITPLPRETSPPQSIGKPAVTSSKRSLKIFVCHASDDKPRVRGLCHELSARGIDVWFDEEKLLPGQNWRLEIQRALRTVDAVVVCLSAASVSKTGYVQKEIKEALDIADEQPEGSIFVIPVRLEPCEVPDRLADYHWVDIITPVGINRLLVALGSRAAHVGAAALSDVRT